MVVCGWVEGGGRREGRETDMRGGLGGMVVMNKLSFIISILTI